MITGDPSQIDLPAQVVSGLKHAILVLGPVKEIGFTFFDAKDVVRHPVVAAVVRAYAQFNDEEYLNRDKKKRFNEAIENFKNTGHF